MKHKEDCKRDEAAWGGGGGDHFFRFCFTLLDDILEGPF